MKLLKFLLVYMSILLLVNLVNPEIGLPITLRTSMAECTVIVNMHYGILKLARKLRGAE